MESVRNAGQMRLRFFAGATAPLAARMLGAALLLAAATGASSASGGSKAPTGPMPDGRYTCLLSLSIVLGDMIIHDGTYAGPSHHPEAASPARFERREDGSIAWRGPLPAIAEEGLKLVSSRVVDPNGGIAGYTMRVLTPDGVPHAVSCEPKG